MLYPLSYEGGIAASESSAVAQVRRANSTRPSARERSSVNGLADDADGRRRYERFESRARRTR
jgi:hypothetical protein